MKSAKYFLVVLVVFIANICAAQTVPGLINYQGRVTDLSGAPLSGSTVSMRFELYDGDTGGASLLWGETQKDVSHNNGIYSVILGSVKPIPSSVLSGGTVYLEVKARGETLSPRQRLTSTPYAANSDMLDGMDSTDFALAGSGLSFQRIVAVSPVPGDSAASGQALLDAMAGITDASTTNAYLVFIEPGLYNLGSNSLVMKEWVGVKGVGIGVTKITAAGNSSSASGTVIGANNSAISFLTIENTGGDTYAVGMYNSGGTPLVSDLYILASGGNYSYGMFNENGAMAMVSRIIMFVSGNDTETHGILNIASNPYLENINISVVGSAATQSGIYNNNSSSPKMNNVIAYAGGGTSNYGVWNNDGSSPQMVNVNASASGGNFSYGVRNSTNSSPSMVNVVALATFSMTGTYGVYINDNSGPTLTNVIADANMPAPVGTVIGMYVADGSSVVANNSRFIGSGGTTSYGLNNDGSSNSGTVKIDNSRISGGTNGVNNISYTVYLGACQVNNSVNNSGGSATCAGCYDGNYTNAGGFASCP